MVGCIGMANPSKNVGRRLDLTNTQAVIGLIVAFFTVLGALGAVAQGWAAYHDWACRNKRPSLIACPLPAAKSTSESD